MKIIGTNIKNYKSIRETEFFAIDNITTLVGKNESGKSAILEALYKMNPVDSSQKYVVLDDYPRKLQLDFEQGLIENGEQIVISKWELEPKDIDKIKEFFGDKFLKSSVLEIISSYNKELSFIADIDIKELINFIAHKNKLSVEEINNICSFANLNELKEKFAKNITKSAEWSNFEKEILSLFKDFDVEILSYKIFSPFLPKFLYFPNYYTMPGQVSITEIKNRLANKTETIKDKVFLAFLDYANIKLDDLENADRIEALISRLEAVSSRMSDRIFEYWSQNKFLKVKVRCDDGKPKDPAPFNSGKIISVRIENIRHESSVNFTNRSTGFVWFFSFLVWFSQVQKNYGNNIIILLDEPGLSLHAKAQHDLLRYIKEKLLPEHQVILSTHSPFMIDPESLTKCRTVEDIITEDNIILGTKVGDKVLSTDNDTIFPLQAALGYDITQTLFVGKNTLLVEGPSDLLYLQYFSSKLLAQKRVSLDPRWTISPTGGIDKISSFVSLLYGQKLNIAVLSDFHDGDKRKIENLNKSDLLKKGHLLTANMFCDSKIADIEDIIGKELYVYLINNCYRTALKYSSVKDDLILDFIKAEACKLKELEDFNHYTPAEFMVQNPTIFEGCSDYANALDRFEKLFKTLNALL